MVKQMISFTEPQRSFLKMEARRLGIPIAELVRRIVDAHIESKVKLSAKRLGISIEELVGGIIEGRIRSK